MGHSGEEGQLRIDLADEIKRRTFELARSGRDIDCTTIENELADEGFAEANNVLQDPQLGADLRATCSKHWRFATTTQLPVTRQKEPNPPKWGTGVASGGPSRFDLNKAP